MSEKDDLKAGLERAASLIQQLHGDLFSIDMAVEMLLKEAGHTARTTTIVFRGYSDRIEEKKP